MKNEKILNEKILTYNVEFVAEGGEDNDYIISGTAIKETTSLNRVRYPADVLREAAQSLEGVPLLKDHHNSVDSIVGRVTEAMFNEDSKAVRFKAQIMDSAVSEKIKQGLIKHVSVGSHFTGVKSETVDEKRIFVPTGIKFLELSLVAVPGVAGATIDTAIAEFVKEQNEVLDNLEEETKLREHRKLLLIKHKLLLEKKLTTKARKALPSSAFAYPPTRNFPIQDASHVRSALAFISQGKWGGVPPAKRKAVLKKVIAKAKKFGITVGKGMLKKAGI